MTPTKCGAGLGLYHLCLQLTHADIRFVLWLQGPYLAIFEGKVWNLAGLIGQAVGIITCVGSWLKFGVNSRFIWGI